MLHPWSAKGARSFRVGITEPKRSIISANNAVTPLFTPPNNRSLDRKIIGIIYMASNPHMLTFTLAVKYSFSEYRPPAFIMPLSTPNAMLPRIPKLFVVSMRASRATLIMVTSSSSLQSLQLVAGSNMNDLYCPNLECGSSVVFWF